MEKIKLPPNADVIDMLVVGIGNADAVGLVFKYKTPAKAADGKVLSTPTLLLKPQLARKLLLAIGGALGLPGTGDESTSEPKH